MKRRKRNSRRLIRSVGFAVAALMIGVLVWWLLSPPGLPDFAAIEDVKQRKVAFFDYLAPVVEDHNIRARRSREVVLGLDARFKQTGSLSNEDRQRLVAVAEEYGLSTDVETGLLIDRALRRVDELPIGLVVGQAAVESGWGTSRIAREGNNLFGRRCFSDNKSCEVAAVRESGEVIRYRVFGTPADSVKRYFQDLNTLMTHKAVRDIRHQRRTRGEPINGLALAEGLAGYSSRGAAYARQVARVIRDNQFDARAQGFHARNVGGG